MGCQCGICKQLDEAKEKANPPNRMEQLATELKYAQAEWAKSEKTNRRYRNALAEIRGLTPNGSELAPGIADMALKGIE